MSLGKYFSGLFSALSGHNHYHENMESTPNMNKSNGDNEEERLYSSIAVNKEINSLCLTNDTVASIPRAFQRGVIGKKISIQSRSENDKFNAEFEFWIKQWGKKGNCDITKRFARGLLERSLIRYYITQGGFLLRHHYNPAWEIPYKVEVIPVSRIDYTQSRIDSNTINGLELGKYGEIKKIFIYKDRNRTDSEAIDYKNLTLFTVPIADATQYTSLSPLVPMLATLDYLNAYQKEELSSAKNRASMSVIIRTHLYNEILKAKKEKAKQSQDGAISEKELAELYTKFKINGTPTGANYIPIDDEVVELSNKADTIFKDLDSSSKQTISASSGLSTQTTIREMPSSYNAALLNAQMDNTEFDILFEDFTEMVWREVIEVKLLNTLVSSGLMNFPDYWSNTRKYRKVEFIRSSTAHIDPAKSEKAISESLSNSTSNEIDAISSKGRDWQENVKKQIQFEVYKENLRKEMLKKYNIADREENEGEK